MGDLQEEEEKHGKVKVNMIKDGSKHRILTDKPRQSIWRRCEETRMFSEGEPEHPVKTLGTVWNLFLLNSQNTQITGNKKTCMFCRRKPSNSLLFLTALMYFNVHTFGYKYLRYKFFLRVLPTQEGLINFSYLKLWANNICSSVQCRSFSFIALNSLKSIPKIGIFAIRDSGFHPSIHPGQTACVVIFL